MVVRRLAEAVEGQGLGLLGVSVAGRADQVRQHVDRQAAVAIGEVAQLQAEADVAGLEDIGAPVVLHRLPPLDVGLAGGALDLVQDGGDGASVEAVGHRLVAGAAQHGAEPLPHLAHRPADGVAVDDRVHATDIVLALGIVDVAPLDVAAVEAQQRHLAPVEGPGHLDDGALVGVAVNVGVPLLVTHDEGDPARLKTRFLDAHTPCSSGCRRGRREAQE